MDKIIDDIANTFDTPRGALNVVSNWRSQNDWAMANARQIAAQKGLVIGDLKMRTVNGKWVDCSMTDQVFYRTVHDRLLLVPTRMLITSRSGYAHSLRNSSYTSGLPLDLDRGERSWSESDQAFSGVGQITPLMMTAGCVSISPLGALLVVGAEPTWGNNNRQRLPGYAIARYAPHRPHNLSQATHLRNQRL